MKAEVQKTVLVEISEDELDLLQCVLSYVPTSTAHEWGHSAEEIQNMRDELGQVEV